MKLGTDFSGIGSPESALKRLNLEVDEVFACEIDKYARKSFNELHNPSTMYEDITTRNHSEVPQLDLYVAGFPCQSFSLAGKRGGFEDTRGTLFFNVAEFIKENQPKCFILENVKGLLSHDNGRTYQTITDVLTNGGGTLNGQIGLDSIDNGLGYHVYAKVLNSKDYGIPQNRERIFLVGFKEFREFRFPKKMELKLRLKNLLENEVDDKYYLSDKMIKTITTPSGGDWNSGKMSFNTDIAKCIRANTHKMGRADTDNYIISHSLFPRTSKTGKGGSGHLSKTDGTSYCVDTGCSQGVEVIQLNESKESGGKQPFQQKRVYDSDGLSPCLDTGSGRRNVSTNKRIRRLTPLECWRLQGYTDEQFYAAQKVNSDTQLYKQAGNSITVNVMVELFKKIYNRL